MLYLLINPFLIFFLLLFFGFFLKNRSRTLSRFCWIVAGLWIFTISTSPLPQWLIFRLERQYQSVNLETIRTKDSVHVIVLGGGSSIAPDLPPNNQLSLTALGRLVEGVRIYHQIPFSKLVLSGHSSSRRTTIAEMMAFCALDLKVNPKDTLMVTTPSNTEEESIHYSERFPEKHTLILVTNANHMPRAIKNFELRGLSPIAAPTNHWIKVDPLKSPYNFKPSLSKIQMMQVAIKEYLGLWYITWQNF